MYVENMESPFSKSPSVLYPTPGLQSKIVFPESPIRAMFSQDGRSFAVAGFRVYEWFEDYTYTLLGEVAIDTKPATISSSGDAGGQLFITSGGFGYGFDLVSNTWLGIVVTSVQTGGYLDGYFLALDTVNSTFRVSSQFDVTVWPPLQIALREQGSDKWIGMLVNYNEVWLLGTQTAEVWYDAGTAPFPFAPFPNGFLKFGIAAPFALANLGRSIVWLEHNVDGVAMVMRSNGFTADRISTHAIEFAIQGYGTLTDAQAFSYQDQGHEFCILTFPTAGKTWVYDSSTGAWHERGHWVPSQADYEAYRPLYHVHEFGKHFVGDRLTGTIFQMSIDFFTDIDGAGIRRLRTCPHLSVEQKYVLYKYLQIDMEVGVGTPTGQGANPMVTLRVSNDGGYSFPFSRTKSLGKTGERLQRVRWRSLGRARDRVFEWSISDPVPVRVVAAYLEIAAQAA